MNTHHFRSHSHFHSLANLTTLSFSFSNIFTLTRSPGTVGIGAYLVRLGQRVIQKRNAPIILTGFQALNKVLGKPLYSSNNQVWALEDAADN